MTPDGSAACNGMKIIETKEYSAPSLFNLFLLADPSREMIERYIREEHRLVIENGLLCRDMVVLKRDFQQ